MSTKKDPRLIPNAAMLDKKEYVAATIDTKGIVEKTLRETNSSFGKTLHQAEEDVRSLRSKTGKAASSKAVGEKVNIHDVVAAVDKARHSFEQLAAMRNKMIEAYREILKKEM